MIKRVRRSAFAVLLAVMMAFGVLPQAFALEEPPETFSETYVVMDAATGQALFGKEMHRKMYPASITKVLTVALALEDHVMGEKITVTESMLQDVPEESSHIALQAGEEVTVEQMVYATMLPSANDAANVLAEYNAGSIAAFVQKMNDKAKELGAVNTNFVNANGLPNEDHYTTAYDFALITRWALTVDRFVEVYGAPDYDMEATNLNEARHFGTDDCLTVNSEYTYDGAVGGKLGWTSQAKHTYSSAAERDDLQFIFISMSTPTQWDKFKDAVALYDYAFTNYERTTVVTADFDIPKQIPVGTEETPTEMVKLDLPVELPAVIPVSQENEGETGEKESSPVTIRHNIPQTYMETVGLTPTISLYHGENLLYTVPLEYEVKPVVAPVVTEPEEKGFEISPAVKWLLTIILVLLMLFVGFFLVLCMLRYRNLKRRRRRTRN